MDVRSHVLGETSLSVQVARLLLRSHLVLETDLLLVSLVRHVLLVGVRVGYLSTFIVSSLRLYRPLVDRGSQQAQVSVVEAISHGVDVGIVVVRVDGDADLVPAGAANHAII